MRRKVHDLQAWARATAWAERRTVWGGFLMVDSLALVVSEEVWEDFAGTPLLLTGAGVRWVRAHPLRAPAGVLGDALTVQVVGGAPQELYVDIHKGGGVDPDGSVWIDDLYLDVAALCNPDWTGQQTLVLDGDELAAAVARGELSRALDTAVRERGRELERQLWSGTYPPLSAVRAYLAAHDAPSGPEHPASKSR